MSKHKNINEIDQAVALNYDGKNAPKVVAKGSDELASAIAALAQQHDIPLHEDPNLVQLLSQIELGDEVPKNLYLAVAKVIAFAYLLSGKRPPGFDVEPEIVPPNANAREL